MSTVTHMSDVILRRAIALLVLVAIMHGAAIALYIYWSVAWFDNVMHFLGGMWVGLVAMWARERYGLGRKVGLGPYGTALMLTLVVGAAWEIFEYIWGVAFVVDNYALDTASDFVMDFLGAAAAVLYVGHIRKRIGNVTS